MNIGVYRAVRAVARALMMIFFPFRAVGAEQIPREGGLLLCGNHLSLLDPIALCAFCERPVSFMAKKELFGFGPFGRFLRALGAFPVDRGASDLSAMRQSFAILKEGGALGIFPQGHREKDARLPVQSGAALIALRSRAPVIPFTMEKKLRLFRRTPIRVGEKVDLTDLYGKTDSASVREAAARIERAIRGEEQTLK